MNFQVENALNLLRRTLNQTSDPAKLREELRLNARALEIDSLVNDALIFEKIVECVVVLIEQGDANDDLVILLHNWLIQKDAQVNPDWGNNSPPNSIKRRANLCRALELDETLSTLIEKYFPPFLNGHILIADNHIPWLTTERKENDGYYGPSILRYQREVRGMAKASIAGIDQASDQILDYLSDPKGIEAYSSRGLVVGYVQSGKTTNINVLIAKAIDSGYRLIVVFAGLTDVLRSQTQRRVDKEVVGKILIETDERENEGGGYRFHNDWDDFIEHTPKPGHKPGPKIERMTTRFFDFSRGRGVSVFTDDWVKTGTSVRIVVVKKQTNRLKNLVKELERLSKSALNALPVLVIDDESDQASINTYRPNKLDNQGNKARTTTNRVIVQMLKLLPRCQYIGYTATPFANVFINPDDAEDLFPKDFVYALAPPLDYMGVKNFHDLDNEFQLIEDIPDEISNKKKHVRDILGDVDDDDSLEQLRDAIDAFVVAGAIKLYRSKVEGQRYRHHTMFYTDSTKRADHDLAMDQIKNLWNDASYNSSAGITRLKKLYTNDFLKFSELKNEIEFFPKDFETLRPFVDEAVQKINEPFNGYSTILVVNSDNSEMSPDFEMQEIWKIVIGGSKLSRGYTIEGLTITYFRRKSAAQATLLQMGRWFGYRGGYSDLVRLYISRNEKHGRAYLDLYKAFEAICQDEEAFRSELRRYEVPNPDGSRLTPKDIPPLVQNTHPMLKPDQPNKMWNARLKSRNFGGSRRAFGSSSIEQRIREDNSKLFVSLFENYKIEKKCLAEQGQLPFYLCSVPNSEMVKVLNSFRRSVELNDEKLLKDFINNQKNGIRNWLIALPQVVGKGEGKPWVVNSNLTLDTHARTWDDESKKFTTLGTDAHRQPCYEMVQLPYRKNENLTWSETLLNFKEQSGLAVLLTYPLFVRNHEDFPESSDPPAIGFEYFLPANGLPMAGYEVMRPDKKNDIVVDVIPMD
jgi:hypothetical protein